MISTKDLPETAKVTKEKGTQLSMFDKGRIIGKLEVGIDITDIARAMGPQPSTVGTAITKYKKRGNTESKKCSGRPKKIMEGDGYALAIFDTTTVVSTSDTTTTTPNLDPAPVPAPVSIKYKKERYALKSCIERNENKR